jgi:transcriptional regulator with XRE-family HTH domain
MRPACLTPKLRDSDRSEIRRLRRENPRIWTQQKLAERFGVDRSTIARTLRRRMRISIDQEMEGLRLAAESGSLETVEVLRLKQEEWKRQLIAETDLVRQQQFVNLIKSVESMLDPEKLREAEMRRYKPEDQKELVRRAIEALRARPGPDDAAPLVNDECTQTMPHSGACVAHGA